MDIEYGFNHGPNRQYGDREPQSDALDPAINSEQGETTEDLVELFSDISVVQEISNALKCRDIQTFIDRYIRLKEEDEPIEDQCLCLALALLLGSTDPAIHEQYEELCSQLEKDQMEALALSIDFYKKLL